MVQWSLVLLRDYDLGLRVRLRASGLSEYGFRGLRVWDGGSRFKLQGIGLSGDLKAKVG